MLQCFALYTNMKRDGDTLVAALEMADIFRGIMAAHPEKIGQVKTWADLEANRAAGRLSGMLTIEEGDCCRANPAVLRTFYELGVRIMTLTWNFENDLAWPNLLPDLFGKVDTTKPNTTKGLKEMGFEFVAEMERLGIIVDVSHLSDAGFWDISRCATRPFIASHPMPAPSAAMCATSPTRCCAPSPSGAASPASTTALPSWIPLGKSTARWPIWPITSSTSGRWAA